MCVICQIFACTYHVIVIEQISTTIDAAKDNKQLFRAVGFVEERGFDKAHAVAGTQFLLQGVAVLGMQNAKKRDDSCIVSAYIETNGLDVTVDLCA